MLRVEGLGLLFAEEAPRPSKKKIFFPVCAIRGLMLIILFKLVVIIFILIIYIYIYIFFFGGGFLST